MVVQEGREIVKCIILHLHVVAWVGGGGGGGGAIFLLVHPIGQLELLAHPIFLLVHPISQLELLAHPIFLLVHPIGQLELLAHPIFDRLSHPCVGILCIDAWAATVETLFMFLEIFVGSGLVQGYRQCECSLTVTDNPCDPGVSTSFHFTRKSIRILSCLQANADLRQACPSL
jgi:hypothetical protein